MAERESAIEAYLVKRVEELGGIAYKLDASKRKGSPDRLIVLPGFVGFVEVKTGTGELNEHQLRECVRLGQMGALHYTIRSKAAVDNFTERRQHG